MDKDKAREYLINEMKRTRDAIPLWKNEMDKHRLDFNEARGFYIYSKQTEKDMLKALVTLDRKPPNITEDLKKARDSTPLIYPKKCIPNERWVLASNYLHSIELYETVIAKLMGYTE